MPRPTLIANFTARPASRRQAYSDARLLAELTLCADRLGHSPTIDEFAADGAARVHPATIVARFGSWNAAKRRAGLAVSRLHTDQELLQALRELAARLGRTPSAAEIEAARPLTASRSTYSLRFGGTAQALKAAGLDVAIGVDEQLDAAIDAGARMAARTGEIPTMGGWHDLRAAGESLPSEWRIYRLCQGAGIAPWQAFTALVEDRLRS
jgi:hypothetical protein